MFSLRDCKMEFQYHWLFKYTVSAKWMICGMSLLILMPDLCSLWFRCMERVAFYGFYGPVTVVVLT